MNLNPNSESSGKKFKLHPDGCFEDAWGVIKRLGSDGMYEEWIGGPLVVNPDIDSFAWPALDSFDSVPVIRERVSAFENRYALLGRITMHGTLSIQKTLPRGTVEDVRREVVERISTCGRNGGLIVCPSNMLQNDTPLENIVALYDTDRAGP